MQVQVRKDRRASDGLCQNERVVLGSVKRRSGCDAFDGQSRVALPGLTSECSAAAEPGFTGWRWMCESPVQLLKPEWVRGPRTVDGSREKRQLN